MVVDEEADMEVEKVADMEVNKVTAMEMDKMANMVADMEVDHVTDMVADEVAIDESNAALTSIESEQREAAVIMQESSGGFIAEAILVADGTGEERMYLVKWQGWDDPEDLDAFVAAVAFDHGLVGEGCHGAAADTCAGGRLAAALRAAPVVVAQDRCSRVPEGVFCCG